MFSASVLWQVLCVHQLPVNLILLMWWQSICEYLCQCRWISWQPKFLSRQHISGFVRTIYWWPLSTCATNLRRGEKQNWNRDFGGKVDQVGEAGQSRALPGHLCWICIFCTFVFLLLCWICIFLYLCFYSSKGSLRIYISCVVLVVFIFIAG